METEPPRSEPRDLRGLVLTLLVIAVVLCGFSAAYVVYSNMQGSSFESYDTVELGDFVEVDYIGRLPDGRVFDTSILEVALDDVRYPKSLTFSKRANESYNPLTMTAGQYGVAGSTIKGFALGVLGMRDNETRIVEIPPEDAYPINPEMIVTIDIDQEIPATQAMSEADFRDKFGVDPIPMATVPHYFWKWDVLVVSNVGGTVTFRHEPTVGQTVAPFGDPTSLDDPSGWFCSVVAFDKDANNGVGKVVIEHHIDQEDVYFIKGVYEDGMEFILWAYDADEGTFEIHKIDPNTGYNGEIYGRMLFFEITIVGFAPG